MQITAHNAHIKLEFRYDKRIVDRIKSHLPQCTFDKAAKCWWLPAGEAHRLPDAFPKAEFSYDAIGAICNAESALGERFYRMCTQLGIALHIDAGGRVVASGDNVSQEVATEVARRSELLKPHVQAQRDEAPVQQPFADAQPTAADERMAAGLRNAWEADRRKKGIVAGKSRKRYEKRGVRE